MDSVMPCPNRNIFRAKIAAVKKGVRPVRAVLHRISLQQNIFASVQIHGVRTAVILLSEFVIAIDGIAG